MLLLLLDGGKYFSVCRHRPCIEINISSISSDEVENGRETEGAKERKRKRSSVSNGEKGRKKKYVTLKNGQTRTHAQSRGNQVGRGRVI